jgi:hypothetical protein
LLVFKDERLTRGSHIASHLLAIKITVYQIAFMALQSGLHRVANCIGALFSGLIFHLLEVEALNLRISFIDVLQSFGHSFIVTLLLLHQGNAAIFFQGLFSAISLALNLVLVSEREVLTALHSVVTFFQVFLDTCLLAICEGLRHVVTLLVNQMLFFLRCLL